jgi:mlo protein
MLARRQMGSKYKAALIPRRIRETIHGWGKATRKKRRRRRGDDSTARTETSTVCSLTDDDEDDFDDHHHGPSDETPRPGARGRPPYLKIEMLRQSGSGHDGPRPGTPCFHPAPMPTPGGGRGSGHAMLLQQASVSAPSSPSYRGGNVTRSASMPGFAALRMGSGTPTRMSHEEPT